MSSTAMEGCCAEMRRRVWVRLTGCRRCSRRGRADMVKSHPCGRSLSPHPNPLPRGEGAVALALTSRSLLHLTSRGLSLSLGERAGVRGNKASLVLESPAYALWSAAAEFGGGRGERRRRFRIEVRSPRTPERCRVPFAPLPPHSNGLRTSGRLSGMAPGI